MHEKRLAEADAAILIIVTVSFLPYVGMTKNITTTTGQRKKQTYVTTSYLLENFELSLEKKEGRAAWGESPGEPCAYVALGLVWPEWKVLRDDVFLGKAGVLVAAGDALVRLYNEKLINTFNNQLFEWFVCWPLPRVRYATRRVSHKQNKTKDREKKKRFVQYLFREGDSSRT